MSGPSGPADVSREGEERLNEVRALLRAGGPAAVAAMPGLLDDPAVEVRWAALHHLHSAALQGADLAPLLPALEAARADGALVPRQPWPRTLGDEALAAIVMHRAGRQQWDELRRLLSPGGAQTEVVLSALQGPGDLSPLLADLASFRRAPDPHVRGCAAAVLVRQHHRTGRWEAIAALLDDGDYAVRWYALSSLDALAEQGHDLAPILPAVVRVFARPSDELEAAHSVRYRGTLRQMAAWLLMWMLGTRRKFRTAESWVVEGVDLKQVPEILAELRDRRGMNDR